MSAAEYEPILAQAAKALQRARRLPPGAHRNGLRQLARVLLVLHRGGLRASIQIIEGPTKH